MTTRIAFLRAVNLGKRTVRNARVVELLEGLGFTDVWTFVNSGNAVFDATGKGASIELAIERALEDDHGFEVTTFTRTTAELRKALAVEPFTVGPGDTYFITFLKSAPSKAAARALEDASNSFDTIEVKGRDVHWHMKGKSTDTQVPSRVWHDAVGKVGSTSRNVTMLTRLLAKIDG